MADVVAEERNIAGPSDFIFTRGNPDDAEEEEDDTDDIDHSGEHRIVQRIGVGAVQLHVCVYTYIGIQFYIYCFVLVLNQSNLPHYWM